MKTIEQIRREIKELKKLAAQYPDDAQAQASIAGQINVLEWVINFSNYG
jgi:hypothetical protein